MRPARRVRVATPPRRLGALVLVLATTTTVSAACGAGGTDLVATSAPATSTATSTATTGTASGPADGPVTWADRDPGPVASQALVRIRIEVPARTATVRVELEHAQPVALPDGCVPSSVGERLSAILDTDLVCVPAPATEVLDLTAIVLGETGEEVSGRVTTVATGSAAQEPGGSGTVSDLGTLPARTITGGEPELSPDLRLVSSPDFLNGDVGDLADGPGSWASMPPAERTPNSVNAAYEAALDTILDDWQGLDPAGVLVAGDLVDGRWGYDDTDSGNFGPVGTRAEQRDALRRAARTYYPQITERFAEHDLGLFPAMGDHEYGDNPWPRRKRALADDFKTEFAREFTTDAGGRPLFADHPAGPARLTAYAGRPSPDVQVVTLDVFDITPRRARIGVDPQQLRWLRGVLRRAQRDDVEWVVVQAHTPILYPVRTRASSNLHYPRGSDSRLWKLFTRFGVDLYLAGEVHDTTATEADGIVQITHGGLFQFGLTTALVLDQYGDRLYVTLRDYAVTHAEAPDGVRLWETRRNGMPADLRVDPEVAVIGTASIVGRGRSGARLSGASGILVPTRDAR